MDFSLSPPLLALRDKTRQFIAEQVIPLENDERQSSHGPSEALRRELAQQEITPQVITDVRETAGFGVEAEWHGQQVSLARPTQAVEATALASELSIGGAPVQLIYFADQLRPDAQETIVALRKKGVEPTILSGDRAAAVAPVCR